MTNIEQAKQFILKKLNDCFLFTTEKYPKSIFHIYDKQALRQKKLLRLSGLNDEIVFKPDKNSLYLFEQDYKYKRFWYDYTKIHTVLNEKFSINDQQINDLFRVILDDDTKWKQLTPRRYIMLI